MGGVRPSNTAGAAEEPRSHGMIRRPSRRRFLQSLGASGAVIVSPAILGQTACSMQGSERGVLRLVFYSDVHARTEWEWSSPTDLVHRYS